MPPPRRFSAAPTLTCPHRNKSSSHSSSSLHHTYSIDSSESMITVIPATRPGQEFKRTPRGSLTYQGAQADTSGSFYALPRSPLSPRSPSRCSPGVLTPNTADPQTTISFDTPHSPTTAVVSASQLQKQPSSSPAALKSQVIDGNTVKSSSPTSASPADASFLQEATTVQVSLSQPPSGSRESPDEVLGSLLPNLPTICDPASQAHKEGRSILNNYNLMDNQLRSTIESYTKSAQAVDNISPTTSSDAPIICETINDFCARHSREEMEYLVGQISSLKISDCYFSEKKSSLCTVIELKHNHNY